MLPRDMGRLLNVIDLLSWDKDFPRVGWGFQEIGPYEWEIQSLDFELKKKGHWSILDSKGRLSRRTISGVPYQAIIYWLYGGKELNSVEDIESTCGKIYCLNPDHLSVKVYETPVEVVESSKTVINYVQGPPVVILSNKRKVTPGSEETRQSRMKCIIRKAWYPDETTARKKARESGMREYPCNMCNGWHITHKGKISKNQLRRRNRKMPYS